MKKIVVALLMFISVSLSAQDMATYTFSIKGNDTIKLDVFTPKNIKKSDTLPVLLWMHGGGFSGSHRAYPDDNKLVKYVAKEQNYIGVSIDYRQLRKNTATGFGCDCSKDEKLETFKQAVIDYMDAAKYIVVHAKKLQIDTTKIIAGGSSAGAVVDASYINKDNVVPSVLYHGTKDQLVPFNNAAHHFCEPTRDGYIILDGSNVIAKKLADLEKAYYFNIVKEGGHEVSSIPFEDLDKIFNFFEQTIINNEVIQTKIIKAKN